MEPEVVQIPRPAFAFCRISLTALLWLALWLDSRWLIFAVFVILAFSALLKVHRSPLIVLYRETALRLWPSERAEFLLWGKESRGYRRGVFGWAVFAFLD